MLGKSTKGFFASKFNIFLVFALTALLLTFGVVTGVVTVPRFRNNDTFHRPSSSDLARYAVIPENFADPCLINDGNGTWYAFATRTDDRVHVQMASAPGSNISEWTLHKGYDPLPKLGAWANTKIADPAVWAPYVVASRNNTYVMYYSALPRNSTRKHCIGAATSSNIKGPYAALDDAIVCDFPTGVIDPAFFHDPYANISYLVYKTDGNSIGVGGACSNTGWPNTPTPLMAVELSAEDLTTPIGSPFELLKNLQSDGPNVESPVVWHYTYTKPASLGGGQIFSYHIAFNSGCYADSSYRIEHIICIGHPGQTLRDCLWSDIRGDPAHPDTEIGNGGGIFTGTLLMTGDTIAKLFAPGGPSLGSVGPGTPATSNVYSKYMIFHADVNMAYFEHPDTTISQEERIQKGWDRRRGMFVAELEYWGQEDMVKVKDLVIPAGRSK